MDSKNIPVLYCENCYMSQQLKIPMRFQLVEKTVWEADYIRLPEDIKPPYSDEVLPTFSIEQGDATVEWEPEFICPNCKMKSWVLNGYLIYDEDNEQLFMDLLEPDNVLGWIRPGMKKTKENPNPELPQIRHVRDVINALQTASSN